LSLARGIRAGGCGDPVVVVTISADDDTWREALQLNVDLLVSERDARRLMTMWNTQPEPASASPLFRSKVFAKAGIARLPIEIMAGFEVRNSEGWRPIQPRSRQLVQGVFVPTAAEQIEFCRLFGRPKDLARIPALEALA